MILSDTIKLDFKDVLICPRPNDLKSRSQVNLIVKYKFKYSNQTYTGIPIIAANMDSTGTFEISKALANEKCFTCIHKHYSLKEWGDFLEKNPECAPYVGVSSGISTKDFDKLQDILTKYKQLNTICLDVANGYSSNFVNFVSKVRKRFPTHTIIAGNVVTGEMTKILLNAGADIVKIGIGPGSVCTTRKKTGVGYPQLSAIIECAKTAHSMGGHIIADGGCTNPGDITKALGAGADFVMIGGLFAGHDESGGKLITIDHKRYKEFYGMASLKAQEKYNKGLANYRSSEGKYVRIPYRGPIKNTILDILGGLRSACTYTGSAVLSDLKHKTNFIRVTQQTNEIYHRFE